MNLQDVLTRNQGSILTPELIVGILAATSPPDRTLVGRVPFDVEEYKGLTFRTVRMADVLPQLQVLHKAHWKETEGYRHGLAILPDYPRMLQLERDGQFIVFGVFDANGKMLGNTACHVYTSLHTQTLAAKEDTLYLDQEIRKGFTAVRFFKYCEAQLVKLGVREITLDIKLTNDVGKVWERQGYQFVSRVLTKVFA